MFWIKLLGLIAVGVILYLIHPVIAIGYTIIVIWIVENMK